MFANYTDINVYFGDSINSQLWISSQHVIIFLTTGTEIRNNFYLILVYRHPNKDEKKPNQK